MFSNTVQDMGYDTLQLLLTAAQKLDPRNSPGDLNKKGTEKD